MPIKEILSMPVGKLTNQQLADLALAADQHARQCRDRGDYELANAYKRDRDDILSKID